MPAQKGDAVTVHYIGRLTDGTLFDTSLHDEPIEFVLGEGLLLPSFEEAIEGMDVGDLRQVVIPCDKAYGEHRKELIQTVDRKLVPKGLELEPGMQVGSTSPEGEEMVITVVSLSSRKITIDANHPLAGEDLDFEIELLALEKPAKSA